MQIIKTNSWRRDSVPRTLIHYRTYSRILAYSLLALGFCYLDAFTETFAAPHGAPTLVVQDGPVVDGTAIAFSPDGQLILTGSTVNRVQIWEVRTGRLLRTLQGSLGRTNAIAVSHNGELVIAGGELKAACIWNIKTGALLKVIPLPSKPVQVSFSADDDLINVEINVEKDEKLIGRTSQIIKTATGERIHWQLTSPERNHLMVFQFSRIPNLAIETAKSVALIDIRTGKTLRHFTSGSESVVNACFSGDGQKVITIDETGVFRVWDVQTGARLLHVRSPLSFSSTGKLSLDPDSAPAMTVDFEGQFALLTLHRDSASLIELKSGRLVHQFPVVSSALERHIRSPQATMSSTGTYVVANRRVSDNSNDGSRVGSIEVWNNERKTLLPTVDQHDDLVTSFVFSPDEKTFASASLDHSIVIWGASSGQLIYRLQPQVGDIKGVSLTAHGKQILFWSKGVYGDGAYLWNLESVGVHVLDSSKGSYKSLFPETMGLTAAARSYDDSLTAVAKGEDIEIFDASKKVVHLSIRSPAFSRMQDDMIEDMFNADHISATNHEYDFNRFNSTSEIGLSRDNMLVAAKTSSGMYVWRLASGTRLNVVTADVSSEMKQHALKGIKLRVIPFYPTSPRVMAYSQDNALFSWDVDGEDEQVPFHCPNNCPGAELKYSNDGKYLTVRSNAALYLWDVLAQKLVFQEESSIHDIKFSCLFENNSRLAVVRGKDAVLQYFDLSKDGKDAESVGLSIDVDDIVTGDCDRGILVASKFGVMRIISMEDGRVLARLAVFDQEALRLDKPEDVHWVSVDPNGRIDGDRLEETNRGMQWVFDDDPLRALPAEIFFRDYYEPRLLPRLISCNSALTTNLKTCALKEVSPVENLNRIQPYVRIVGVASSSMSAPKAEVSVEVAGKEDVGQKNGKTRTEAYDLRLFRNGQLVGQWPNSLDGSEELVAWRARTHIDIPKGASKNLVRFPVQLSSRDAGKPVTFSAYVFNEDRVKSATAKRDYVIPKDIPTRKAKAYIITIGVNEYDAPARSLRFAVRDAEAIDRTLATLEGYEVVRVSLTSAGRDPAAWHATKANIEDVLGRLAGRSLNGGALSGVPGTNRLSYATPDDIVIVTFSGHGYTQAGGKFYLLPSDSGMDANPTAATLARFISSEDLSEWLRQIDSGQMVLIIDACHSAASVESADFKPGPMGDRGLGQLAYDKAMRILAASQADDVALESEHLQQGLLTYALVHDGLELNIDQRRNADLDRDGRLTLAEWLRYGEQHTPMLYNDIGTGRRRVAYVGRDAKVDPHFEEAVSRHVQTPTLFDFAKKALDTIIP